MVEVVPETGLFLRRQNKANAGLTEAVQAVSYPRKMDTDISYDLQFADL